MKYRCYVWMFDEEDLCDAHVKDWLRGKSEEDNRALRNEWNSAFERAQRNFKKVQIDRVQSVMSQAYRAQAADLAAMDIEQLRSHVNRPGASASMTELQLAALQNHQRNDLWGPVGRGIMEGFSAVMIGRRW